MNLKESLPCAHYVASRIRFNVPERTRFCDFVDTLVSEGWKLWQAGCRNDQPRFDCKIVAIECTTTARNVAIGNMPSDAENMAQFVSHLILLALDARKAKRK